MSEHHCHATGCTAEVPREMFMCLKHWGMIPRQLKAQIWAAYRPGQCDDQSPSRAYCLAAINGVTVVAKMEGLKPDTHLYDLHLKRLSRL